MDTSPDHITPCSHMRGNKKKRKDNSFHLTGVKCLVMINEITVSSSSELSHLFIADSFQLTNLTSNLEEQKALQLPFYLRNLTVLFPILDPFLTSILSG